MDFNLTFFTGVGCGLCLGISIFALRKYFSHFADTTKAVKKYATNGEYKLVLVVRTDLQMTKGKIAAQCGHAAVGAYEKALKEDPSILKTWLRTGQAKIALKIDSLESLKQISDNAKKMGLITTTIRDAGRTQIAPNSITVVGIGPAPVKMIDKVTGDLKLL
ncbi:unnamed protein product [Chrysodeixis includens]|uniref:peptidyl-tRNA hydrolase n=1 Tax=Chrysodeixis includens TaxID=689277 RepID=A0A9P0BWM1_CHRIL|nr:unnamed protein product [Chrysodeixis includens]